MKREELGDLIAFLAVVDEKNFTRAAIKLGTSQSAISHVVRRLEERLDVRLLTRTTRNVAPTEAGKHLAHTLRLALSDIKAELYMLDELRSKPAGTIRLTTSKYAAQHLVLPVVNKLMDLYPEINIEISVDHKLVDIVKHGFDAGIRLGEQIEKDMIAVRVGPPVKMVVVASSDYFSKHAQPKTPHELTQHQCINIRFPTSGGVYLWEFANKGKKFSVRVDGQFTCDDTELAIHAALMGRGIACLPDYQVQPLIDEGKLIQILSKWCPPFPGFHLYYPSRRQSSIAFRLFVEQLRYKRDATERA